MATKVDIAGAYIEGRNPFAFERNANGHIILTITGLDLTGEQEIARLVEGGYRVDDYAKFCFTSRATDGYDKNHRLVAGREYKLALVPGKEIPKGSDRSTANLRALGTKYDYGRPLAGHIPRIRESVSDKQMEEIMDIYYIASLHEHIKASGGYSCMLRASRHGDGQWVDACWDYPVSQWSDNGAFAFPVSAS